MPNWCTSTLIATGDKEEIHDLYERMKRLQDMQEPLKPNGFGTTWLGNLVEDLGKSYDQVSCRGSWSDLELIDDKTLKFYTETAWYRCTEVEDLIVEKYPSIFIYFQCEEGGVGIYETNDDSGKYFPERYMIDVENDECYYMDEDDSLDFIQEFFGLDFKNMDEAMRIAEDYNNDENNEDYNIWIHEFEIVS